MLEFYLVAGSICCCVTPLYIVFSCQQTHTFPALQLQVKTNNTGGAAGNNNQDKEENSDIRNP